MTLEARLAAERAKRAGNLRMQAALGEVLATLARGGALDGALATEEPFPDFLLPDAEGRLVSRDALLARGPFSVTFLRGGWCPYCIAMLEALDGIAGRAGAAGAALLAVTPETGGLPLDMKHAHAPGVTMLVDVDSGLAASCGVLYRVPGAYRDLLAGHGIDLATRQGTPDWILPVPATFVVARDGVVTWRHLDANFTRRAEPEDILRALA